MEMAKYIMSILKVDLMVLFSWGFHNPTAIENGLIFKVNGFKHRGKVKVVYNEDKDLFNVSLITNRGVEIETIEGVFFDNLVEVIDNHIEKTNNYSQDVDNWLQSAI